MGTVPLVLSFVNKLLLLRYSPIEGDSVFILIGYGNALRDIYIILGIMVQLV
jgi:hypothetical protein